MSNLIRKNTIRRVGQIFSSGLILMAAHMATPAAADERRLPQAMSQSIPGYGIQTTGSITPIAPGQPVSGVLGDGADTMTASDGTPMDVYSVTAQPGQIYAVTAVSPEIPLQSEVDFNDTTQQTVVGMQAAFVSSAGQVVGYFGQISQPGQYYIAVYPMDPQQPNGTYQIQLDLLDSSTPAPGTPSAPGASY